MKGSSSIYIASHYRVKCILFKGMYNVSVRVQCILFLQIGYTVTFTGYNVSLYTGYKFTNFLKEGYC